MRLAEMTPVLKTLFVRAVWNCAACRQTVKMGDRYNHKEAHLVATGRLHKPFVRRGDNVYCTVCRKPVIKGR